MHISRRSFLGTAAAISPALLSARAEARISGEAQTLSEAIPLAELDTPALLIDAPTFEKNLSVMAEYLASHNVGLRPHAKTHKSADIAKKQLAAGAVGICCAKVSEAEALAAEGVHKLLVTSPITTVEKVRRFVHLAKKNPEAMIVVDSALGLSLLSEAASAAKCEITVLMDLDIGTKRTGVPCGADALAFAQKAAATPHIKVAGVQAYAGHLMHVKGWESRRQRSLEALQLAVDTRKAVEAAGIPCPIFSGGGTGTFDIDVEVPGITDLQCGSYPFMDVQYRIIGDAQGETLETFKPALFVWSAAISQPISGRITLDAGYKALSNENVAPELLDFPGTRYGWGGDEHGLVSFPDDSQPIHLGDKVKIFVAHCDPTVNLYDVYHVVRDGAVVELWPVTARGCSQ